MLPNIDVESSLVVILIIAAFSVYSNYRLYHLSERIDNLEKRSEVAELEFESHTKVKLRLQDDFSSEYQDFRNCMQIKQTNGSARSGLYYMIADSGVHYKAYCSMDAGGGGWTVFQRRADGNTYFFRTWLEYKQGFGNPKEDHWLDFRNCMQIKQTNGSARSGLYYMIADSGVHYKAYCSMDAGGGGWTVFQRRADGNTYFFRTWLEYKQGFGNPKEDHWLDFRNCMQIKQTNGSARSGLYYMIADSGVHYKAYCSMDVGGGGWTVFQRRADGNTYFFRTWLEYRQGFGNPKEDHWLGNYILHELTKTGSCQLLILLQDFFDVEKFAFYEIFKVGKWNDMYRLTIGKYDGDAGDSMEIHNGMVFSTYDRGVDKQQPQNQDRVQYRHQQIGHEQHSINNCAARYGGGWWYTGDRCHDANLNGFYLAGQHETNGNGIIWRHWHGETYSLKSSTMMVRCLS